MTLKKNGEVNEMKWIPADIEMYNGAKDFVDTVLIPLAPISLDSQMKQSSSMFEFLAILSAEIERQFKGRILLMPSLTYLMEEERNYSYANSWAAKLRENNFKHVFFLSCDSEWKRCESELEGGLIWIPSLPLEQLELTQARSLVSEQVRQVMEIFTLNWEKAI
ncbi:YpiF family protein [Actinomycetes bacterium NPDC127524]